MTSWLKWRCRLSGGAAAERVEIARQLDSLPQTQAAFASGQVGYQHVAVIAKTAEHVGTAVVRGEEAMLLKAAGAMDPGQFVTVGEDIRAPGRRCRRVGRGESRVPEALPTYR
jgi:hypothetical protein